MIGKASEIKTMYVDGFGTGFNVVDCGLPDNAIVLDIKFSTSYYPEMSCVIGSALIIYKEHVEFTAI